MFKIEVINEFDDKDCLERPDWNLHFLAMTYVVANRSFDTSTKCGCIATRDKLILSSGFNGPPAGSLDVQVPINSRPDKYWYMEHAERNTIYNACKSGINLRGCVFYVSGVPCTDCLRGMLCAQPTEIVYLCANDTKMNHYKKDVILCGGTVDEYLCRVAPYTKIIEYSGFDIENSIISYLKDIHQDVCVRFGGNDNG